MNTYNRPYYQKLYADMIRDKYPEKASCCAKFFKKDTWIALDIININKILFGESELDKQHRAYDEQSIMYILQYQYDNSLYNYEVAQEFGISRNTLTKWKIAYQEKINKVW